MEGKMKVKKKKETNTYTKTYTWFSIQENKKLKDCRDLTLDGKLAQIQNQRIYLETKKTFFWKMLGIMVTRRTKFLKWKYYSK